MKRNEEIRKEALNWKTDDNEFIAQTAFEAGAKWADSHPENPWIDPTVECCDKDGELYKTVKNGDMYFCYLHGDYYVCAAIKFPDGLYMLTTNSKLVPCFDFDFIMKQPRIPRKDEDTAR